MINPWAIIESISRVWISIGYIYEFNIYLALKLQHVPPTVLKLTSGV